MAAIERIAPEVSLRQACRVLGVSRATLHRRRRPPAKSVSESPHPRQASPLRLTEEERRQVLDLLHSERFVDASPAQVYATLLDENRYLCSERTMYRLLAQNQELREPEPVNESETRVAQKLGSRQARFVGSHLESAG
jgi:putative transposase